LATAGGDRGVDEHVGIDGEEDAVVVLDGGGDVAGELDEVQQGGARGRAHERVAVRCRPEREQCARDEAGDAKDDRAGEDEDMLAAMAKADLLGQSVEQGEKVAAGLGWDRR
jgi:hypothetical protein